MQKEAMHLAKWIGVEHREEVHEEVQRYLRHLLRSGAQNGKRRWRRSSTRKQRTDENAGTSGGVFVAVDSNLEAFVGAEEGAVESIPGNEGRLAQAWVNVREGMRVFSVYFCHSEVWTPSNEALLEAVVKQVRATRHPWLVACDANMRAQKTEKACGFKEGGSL